ncbi:MAG: U32 family peptidase, partial [Acutalibacteraceae bacterium]
LEFLPDFLSYAQECGVDAFIIADLGIFEAAKKYAPNVARHISTQAGVTNYATANVLYNMGASRVVLAREIPLDEIAEMRAKIPKELEIECFVHGAMCVSFSGRCLISSYMTGRDANHGDCAQPCRWKYSLVEETRPGMTFPVEQDQNGTYLFNSKDMCMIEHIPDLVKAGITSFKIEGRAKSEYYVSVVTNAYRAALDAYQRNPSDDFQVDDWIVDEMRKVSYRDYCTGFYYSSPSEDANISYKGGYNREWDVVAVVDKWENGIAYCTQRNRFFEKDTLDVLEVGMKPFPIVAEGLKNEAGETIESTNQAMMKFSFNCPEPLSVGAILRKKREENKRVII